MKKNKCIINKDKYVVKMKHRIIPVIVSISLSMTLMGGLVPQRALASRAAAGSGLTGLEEIAMQAGDHEDAFAPEKGYSLKTGSDKPEYFDLRHVKENGKEVSYITKVKEQNPYGTCWGFGAISAAESSILSSGLAAKDGYTVDTLDLSEKQIAWFITRQINEEGNSQNGEGAVFAEGTDDVARYDAGGGLMFATNMFATGVGPTFEDTDTEDGRIYRYQGKNGEVFSREVTWTDDSGKEHSGLRKVYYSDEDDWSMPDRYRFHQNYTLKESYILPDPTTDWGKTYHPEATEAIKDQLLNKRAVSFAFRATHSVAGEEVKEDDVMSQNWAQYSTESSQNHVVTIVGYDDNYPRSNFVKGKEPPENGAWLVKNSWGSDLETFPNNSYSHWGLLEGQDIPGSDYQATSGKHTGYFWLSYYDTSIASIEAYSFQETIEGEKISQYDYMPVYEYQEYATESENRMANIFTASRNEKLTDISVFTATPGTKVSYKVYLLNNDPSGPEDGLCLVSSSEKEYPYGGYHRETLNSKDQLPLYRGQKYSVVITERTPGGRYSVSFGKSPVSARHPSDPRTFRSVVNKGESYLYIDGSWHDFSDEEILTPLLEADIDDPQYYEACADNFPIKAFTVPGDSKGAYLVVANRNRYTVDEAELKPGDTRDLEALLKGAGDELDNYNPEISWTSTDPSVFTVEKGKTEEYKATIKAVNPGNAYLFVDAGIYGKRVVGIKVDKLKLTHASLPGTETGAPMELAYTRQALTPKPAGVYGEQIGNVESKLLTEGKDYTISYQDNVRCGRASLIITGTGEYEGTIKNNETWDNLVFVIVPAKAVISKVTPGKNKLTVNFVSQKDSGISGYELTCKESGTGQKKTVKIEDPSANSAVIGGLTPDKTYELSLRAYVTTYDAHGIYNKEYDTYDPGYVDHFGQASDPVTSGKVTDREDSGSGTNVDPDSGSASKSANPMKLKVTSRTYKRSKLTRKKTFSIGVKKAQGKVTYSLDKKARKVKIRVSAKGKVTVPAKCKKGTYRITVKAAGNAKYKSASKKVTIKVK